MLPNKNNATDRAARKANWDLWGAMGDTPVFRIIFDIGIQSRCLKLALEADSAREHCESLSLQADILLRQSEELQEVLVEWLLSKGITEGNVKA